MRSIALQVLYEYESTKHNAESIINRISAEQALSTEATIFIHELVSGVIDNRAKIDSIIQKFAPAWPLAQIPIIDRNILRLAIFESLLNNKVPPKVVINEAVELAKKFGSDNSARFVNGVLGAVHNQDREKCETANGAGLKK